jgi:Metallo-peptidase family M12B Reprolysin-like
MNLRTLGSPNLSWAHAFALTLLAGAALQTTATSQKPEAVAPDLLKSVAHFVSPADPMIGKFPLLRDGRRVAVDFKLLDEAKAGQVIRIEFKKGLVYYARLVKREVAPTLKNGYHWHGTLEGKVSSQFIITVGAAGIASWFSTADENPHTLTIEGNRKEAYARLYDDSANHAKSAVPTVVDQAIQLYQRNGGVMQSNNSGCSDNPNQIFVGCYYTSVALVQSLGSVAVRISNGIAQANTVLRNSGLALRLYLRINKRIVNSVEGSSMGRNLSALQSKTDRIMDQVHTERKPASVDLVALIVGDLSGHGSTTGIGYRPSVLGHFNPTSGFSVTEWNAIAGYTLIHEIGHNLACGHDKANASGTHLYTYAYGFNKKFCDRGFPIFNRNYLYTVMSYRPKMSCSFPYSCIAQRVASFSGTNITWNFGSPCGKHTVGTSTSRNNLVIANTRARVANYSRMVAGTNLSRFVTVRSTNPSSRVAIAVSRTDSNGRRNGSTTFSREYCGTTSIILTAPSIVGANPFKRWRLDGAAQPLGRRTLAFSTTRNRVAYADYYVHTHGSFRTFGTGCAGTGGKVPILRGIGHPDIGNLVTFQTSNARPNSLGRIYLGISRTRWGTIPLPLNLAVIGMHGCTLDVSLDLVLPLVTNSSGVNNLTLRVQNVPSTIGQHFYWQSGIFDAGAPRNTKAAHSNALDLVVGGNR